VPILRAHCEIDGIALDLPGGGRDIELDPTRRLPIVLSGRPRNTPYEARVCIYGSSGTLASGKLAALHARGWTGRTRCHVAYEESKGWLVLDGGSVETIHVNGQAISGYEHRLVHGDRIEPAIGLTFTFLKDGSSAFGLA
jgi:hypothetical protein